MLNDFYISENGLLRSLGNRHTYKKSYSIGYYLVTKEESRLKIGSGISK